MYNPKTLKQIATGNIKRIDEEIDKKLAKKMIIPDFFLDEYLKTGFKINLEGHKINHANSILTITPKFLDFGIELRYVNKIWEEMATIYARLLNQYIFKNHIIIPASFYIINEDDQRSDEIELYINLNINHNLTESDIDNINFKSQVKHKIQIQETKASGWIFDINNSKKIRFYKTAEMDGSSYVKILSKSSALIINKN